MWRQEHTASRWSSEVMVSVVIPASVPWLPGLCLLSVGDTMHILLPGG